MFLPGTKCCYFVCFYLTSLSTYLGYFISSPSRTYSLARLKGILIVLTVFFFFNCQLLLFQWFIIFFYIDLSSEFIMLILRSDLRSVLSIFCIIRWHFSSGDRVLNFLFRNNECSWRNVLPSSLTNVRSLTTTSTRSRDRVVLLSEWI